MKYDEVLPGSTHAYAHHETTDDERQIKTHTKIQNRSGMSHIKNFTQFSSNLMKMVLDDSLLDFVDNVKEIRVHPILREQLRSS